MIIILYTKQIKVVKRQLFMLRQSDILSLPSVKEIKKLDKIQVKEKKKSKKCL